MACFLCVQFTVSGGDGVITILQRSLSSLTYSSLCLPEDIAARGVEDVSSYHYRDDGLRLWGLINRYESWPVHARPQYGDGITSAAAGEERAGVCVG